MINDIDFNKLVDELTARNSSEIESIFSRLICSLSKNRPPSHTETAKFNLLLVRLEMNELTDDEFEEWIDKVNLNEAPYPDMG